VRTISSFTKKRQYFYHRISLSHYHLQTHPQNRPFRQPVILKIFILQKTHNPQ